MQVSVQTQLSTVEYDGYDGRGNDILRRWATPGSPAIEPNSSAAVVSPAATCACEMVLAVDRPESPAIGEPEGNLVRRMLASHLTGNWPRTDGSRPQGLTNLESSALVR